MNKPYVAVVDSQKNAVVARFWHEDGKLCCDQAYYLKYAKSWNRRGADPSSAEFLDVIVRHFRNGYLNAYKVSDHE
jgi:hypothetical protein